MRAAICRRNGPPQSLEIGRMPVPNAGTGQVRIRTEACGLNFPDLLLIQGSYQDKPSFPFVPGGEVSGIIDQIGPEVTGFRLGQAVMATTFLGGLAEHVVARATDATDIPRGMSMDVAAAFTGVYATAYHALAQRAALRRGETLLVLGAAGGTGIAAVQIGKALGARVIAVVGSAAKIPFLEANGADVVLNHEVTRLKDGLRTLPDCTGIDVAFDPVGGDLFDQAARCMNWNGRMLVVGFASGVIPRFAVNLALLKGYAVVGVYYGRFRDEEPRQAAANLLALQELFLAGKVRPPIHGVYPLPSVAEALANLENRSVMGKVVVRVSGPGSR